MTQQLIWIFTVVAFLIFVHGVYLARKTSTDPKRKIDSYPLILTGLLFLGNMFSRLWLKNDQLALIFLILYCIPVFYLARRMYVANPTYANRYEGTTVGKIAKFFLILFIIFVIGIAFLFASISFNWWPTNQQPFETISPTDATNNLKTYTSSDFGFEFKHPDDWVITTNSRPTSPIPVTNFSFLLNGKPTTFAIASDCCREGLIEYRRIPIQVDGKNLGLILYGYAENLGESKIDPKNSSRLAIFAIPPSLLTPTAMALKTEGVDLELSFEVTDEKDALNLLNQILTSFKFASAR